MGEERYTKWDWIDQDDKRVFSYSFLDSDGTHLQVSMQRNRVKVIFVSYPKSRQEEARTKEAYYFIDRHLTASFENCNPTSPIKARIKNDERVKRAFGKLMQEHNDIIGDLETCLGKIEEELIC